ncbi:hypothetical protein [Gimesia chilikensis]|uniref:Uncharacterized protein n=1 Tax=Gimesia chilikensis TaxID=2605989 RepID=A0A517PY96_9PLAN|nr:hypothetical protein [Gimesia chilikensis]QDT24360.1 hypothetical protein HG66A1_61920 [Gimesia chilikensis]
MKKKTKNGSVDKSELRHLLEQRVQVQKIRQPTSDNPFSCPEEIALKYGRSYRRQPLPKGIELGEKKQCFFNAAMLSMHRGLIYVEGFAVLADTPLLIHHAWCVTEGKDAVIDPTSDNLVEYIGIPFRPAIIEEIWLSGSGMSLLNNTKGKWAVLRKTEKQVEAMIADKIK